ncbi:alpha/beta fold hydrolase [Ectothiorhodospira lacustris]|uniref:alpha/beta fold hydrolase n=1 Tax=Ectothiorhodospira lacustris TaxID=2899127 RepID=UPI001EE85D8B|nr:alpha/beta hydrolase [Ectothiorhodospira lacustris]MCG5499843.1 alpha/beta hydrolase [Ectothiorhodospira lacustris]MCG5508991.1 alpha/beta hydrolase [Ectothiorhodospira lacustris]MCG5520782.1 alpha/beta hydrolase [Ectothiorhodospira lacustris]
MKILFLHGWQSTPGGLKPSYLLSRGHEVINPLLDDDDFEAAVDTAQSTLEIHRPQVIVGSSRGGAVAMALDSHRIPLVLLCPAWRRWGTVDRVKTGTIILHSPTDEVIPFADSRCLVDNSRPAAVTLITVGSDHRLADPDSLQTMQRACENHVAP